MGSGSLGGRFVGRAGLTYNNRKDEGCRRDEGENNSTKLRRKSDRERKRGVSLGCAALATAATRITNEPGECPREYNEILRKVRSRSEACSKTSKNRRIEIEKSVRRHCSIARL